MASILFHNMKIVNDKTRTSMEAISSCLGEADELMFSLSVFGITQESRPSSGLGWLHQLEYVGRSLRQPE